MEKRKKENKSIRLKGQLRMYMQWPAIMAVFLVLVNIRYFYAVSENAGYLLIPYLAWITFAGYLNFFISIMNP